MLAEVGADGLSLRAIARELGMVSSAIYRYVESRDELLTLLIIDAYNAIGETAEQAAAANARRTPVRRWVATAEAIRSWALANPHEYALLYGTPVPGYQAPQDTIGPASRVSLALLTIAADAVAAGQLEPAEPAISLGRALRADLQPILDLPQAPIGPELLARLVIAWTQLFGLVSFELFGQTNGLIHQHDDLFRTSATAMARFVGLSAE